MITRAEHSRFRKAGTGRRWTQNGKGWDGDGTESGRERDAAMRCLSSPEAVL